MSFRANVVPIVLANSTNSHPFPRKFAQYHYAIVKYPSVSIPRTVLYDATETPVHITLVSLFVPRIIVVYRLRFGERDEFRNSRIACQIRGMGGFGLVRDMSNSIVYKADEFRFVVEAEGVAENIIVLASQLNRASDVARDIAAIYWKLNASVDVHSRTVEFGAHCPRLHPRLHRPRVEEAISCRIQVHQFCARVGEVHVLKVIALDALVVAES